MFPVKVMIVFPTVLCSVTPFTCEAIYVGETKRTLNVRAEERTTAIKYASQGRSGTCKNCVTCVSQNGGFLKKNLSQVCHKILAILSG